MRRKTFILGLLAFFLILSLSNSFIDGKANTQTWLMNPNFDTSEYWNSEYGDQGDSSDINFNIEDGAANFEIAGETGSWKIKGTPNTTESPGWYIAQKENYQLPHSYDINSTGCHIAHFWAENTGEGQTQNYPCIHFHKNISLGRDMSDYNITSVSLDVKYNASVDSNVDTPNDQYVDPGQSGPDLFSIGDFIEFYVLISGIKFQNSIRVGLNRTKYLGQFGNGNPSILNITDSLLNTVSENDLIRAVSSALEKDNNHSSFILTLGIDIYSEDNDQDGDFDYYNYLIFKSCNLTINYRKKIDLYTSMSLNQIGNKISGENVIISDAKLNFSYSINDSFPQEVALSEFRFKINNILYQDKIVKLESLDPASSPIFEKDIDVRNFIKKDENISISFEVFLKDDFELEDPILLSINNVYLTIETQIISSSNFEPLIYTLLALILSVSVLTITYERIWKYPKTIRNLRKFKNKIRKGKTPNPQQINTRGNTIEILHRKKLESIESESTKTNNVKNLALILSLLFFLSSIYLIINNNPNNLYSNEKCSISSSNGENWLVNSNFNNSESWSVDYGEFGDISDLMGNFENQQGNIYLIGDKFQKEISGSFDDGSWQNFNKSIFLPPDNFEINKSGCFISTTYYEAAPPNGDQSRAYFSTHIKKNISLNRDMSDYEIYSANLDVKYNSSVDSVEGDGYTGQYTVGDFYTFYVMVSNLNGDFPITIARNRTTFSGQGSYVENTKLMETVSEKDVINALEAALDKDPGHNNFTITLGIDIYSEDNAGTDIDYWNSLVYNSFNLSFSYKKKIDKFTSIGLSQTGEDISGNNIQINQAFLKFKYKVNQKWPLNLSPFSEMRILINNNQYVKTINLGNFTKQFKEIEFDVKSLIPLNEPISLSVEIFIGNSFSYEKDIAFAIDDVYLIISYSSTVSGPNLLPFVIGLSIGLIGLVIGIGTYQLYFKYPPIIRKIRKLRKSVRKNRQPKIITLNSYKGKINNIYQDNKEILKTPQMESENIQKISNQ